MYVCMCVCMYVPWVATPPEAPTLLSRLAASAIINYFISTTVMVIGFQSKQFALQLPVKCQLQFKLICLQISQISAFSSKLK